MSFVPLSSEPRSQVDDPSSLLMRFGADEPLMMDAGIALAPWQIAYQTYGTLNADKSNAVLICHALTGDQHVANDNPGDRQARLVADHGRARPAGGHGPLLRDLRQRDRRLHGHHGARLDSTRRPASPMPSIFPS